METETRIKQSQAAKEANLRRHNENLKIFSGRHKGVYYEFGAANPRRPIEIGGKTGIRFVFRTQG